MGLVAYDGAKVYVWTVLDAGNIEKLCKLANVLADAAETMTVLDVFDEAKDTGHVKDNENTGCKEALDHDDNSAIPLALPSL